MSWQIGLSAMKGNCIKLLVLFMIAGVVHAETQRTITINGLQLTFNSETGGLTGLAFPASGEILKCDLEQADLLTLGFPTKEFIPMNLASRHSKAEFKEEDGQLTISWARLGASRPALPLPAGDVEASVVIRPAPDHRSAIFSAHVENHSKGQITQVLFPDLNGLRPIGEDHELTELRFGMGVVNPFAGAVRPEGRARFYPHRLWEQYPFEPIYQMNALRWLDYGTHQGGLSVFQHEWLTGTPPNVLTHRSEENADQLRLVWQHKTAIDQQQTWHSGEFWITPHAHGWAKGIEPYRAYAKSMNPPRKIPSVVSEGLGFQTIWLLQTTEKEADHATFKYSDLVSVARDAHDHGLDQVVLWGWCGYGYLPIRPREELGTISELVSAINEAKKFGVNIVPFVNMKNLDDSLASRYGVKPGNAASWTYHPELIPAMFPFGAPSGQIDIETNNKKWQADVTQEFKRWSDQGITSFCWDVFQEYGDSSLADFMKTVRASIHDKDPDATFGAEPYLTSLERAAQVVDYTWNWLDYTEAGPIANVLPSPRINCNIESSPRVVKMAFADNLYLNVMPKKPELANGSAMIHDQPELSTALKTVAALRRQFLPYFKDGTCLGDSLLTQPACRFVRSNRQGQTGGATADLPPFIYPEVLVSGYQLPDRLLMIVLNNSDAPKTVELASDLAAWLPASARYRITCYDEHGKASDSEAWNNGPAWHGRTPQLPPLGLFFLEFKTGG